jgi:hypothetical protein
MLTAAERSKMVEKRRGSRLILNSGREEKEKRQGPWERDG